MNPTAIARIFLVLTVGCFLGSGARAETGHFHPKGKPPSKHTLKVLEQARTGLPFSDKRDFEENEKGFIAAPDSMKIKAKAGNDAWDMERYQFLASGKQFTSIHPSLQRQSTLNLAFGLYGWHGLCLYERFGCDVARFPSLSVI